MRKWHDRLLSQFDSVLGFDGPWRLVPEAAADQGIHTQWNFFAQECVRTQASPYFAGFTQHFQLGDRTG